MVFREGLRWDKLCKQAGLPLAVPGVIRRLISEHFPPVLRLVLVLDLVEEVGNENADENRRS